MERSSSRLKVFAILVAIMFAALSTRLWFLQVLATEVYAQEAQNNSVRTAKTDALRGEIWTSDQFARERQGRPAPRRWSRTARASRYASTSRS